MTQYLGFLRGTRKAKRTGSDAPHKTLEAVDAAIVASQKSAERVLSEAADFGAALADHFAAAKDFEIGGAQLTTRGLLSGLSDPVLVVGNAEGSVIELYNDAAAQVFGYAPSEVIGNALTLLFPKEKNFKKLLKGAMTAHTSALEVQGKTKDGRTVILEAKASRYDYTTVYVLRDLTARRAAEAKQRAADKQRRELQSVVDSLETVGVFITDPSLPDNPIVFCNAGATRITGYSREELLGRNPRFLQDSDLAQTPAQALRVAVQNFTPHQTVVRNYRKSGDLYLSMLTIKPIFTTRDGQKVVEHWVGLFVDVSEQFNQNKTLSQLDLYLNEVILRSPIGVTIYDGYKNKGPEDYLFSNAAGLDAGRHIRDTLADALLLQRLMESKSVSATLTTRENPSRTYAVTHCLLDGARVLSFFVDTTPDPLPPLAQAVDTLSIPAVLYSLDSHTVTHANAAARKALALAPGDSYDAGRAPLPKAEGIPSYALLYPKDAPPLFAVEAVAQHAEGAFGVSIALPYAAVVEAARPASSIVSLESLPLASVRIDADGYALEVNGHARALFGLGVGSAIGYIFKTTPLPLLRSPSIKNYHVTATRPSGASLQCSILATPFDDGTTLLLIVDMHAAQVDAATQALYTARCPIAVLACQPGLPLVMGNEVFFETYKALPGSPLANFFVLSSRNALPFDAASFRLGASWSGTLASVTKQGGVLTSQTTLLPLAPLQETPSHVIFIQQQMALES